MKILWTQLALFDLDQAYNYISNTSPNRANDIIDRIEQSVTLLQQFPQMGRPGKIPGTKELVIPQTPFILPYRITETTIEILAVIHGAQQWDVRL